MANLPSQARNEPGQAILEAATAAAKKAQEYAEGSMPGNANVMAEAALRLSEAYAWLNHPVHSSVGSR